jgi:hypothetical protein
MTSQSIRELEERLRAARRYVERAQAALSNAQTGNEWNDYKRALQAQLTAERDLAFARGEPTCMPLAWKPLWSSGAPSPHVLSAGDTTYLLYMIDEHDPSWDGESVAIVQFKACYAHRFGGPNDEVVHTHPLYSKGLEPYRAHEVKNSAWIASEWQMNRMHPKFRHERWDAMKHYLLLFHDEMFECLAEGHACEVRKATLGEALAQLASRIG